jgi:hypothetical protein
VPLIGDYLAQDLEKAGALNKIKTLWPSPDLKTLGIHLDVPSCCAQDAGLLKSVSIELSWPKTPFRASVSPNSRIISSTAYKLLTSISFAHIIWLLFEIGFQYQ